MLEGARPAKFCGLAAMCCAALFPAAASASVYWDINGNAAGAGGTTPAGPWSTSDANWNPLADGTGTPVGWTNGETAVFSAGTDATGQFNVTVSGTLTIAGITIEEGGPQISGGTLLMNTGSIARSGGGDATISSPIQGNGALTLGSVGGTGIVRLGSLLTDNGGVRSLVITASGVQWVVGNTGSTYSGDTTLNSGTLIPQGSSTGSATTADLTKGPFGTGTLILNGGKVRALSGGGSTIGNAVSITSDVQLGDSGITQSLNFNGPVTLTGTRTLTCTNGTGANTTFSGAVGDGGSGFGIVKAGAGLLIFSGAGSNTYSGLTSVSGGELDLNKSGGATAIAGNVNLGDGSGTDILKLLASNQIADTAALTFGAAASGTLDIGTFSDGIGTLTTAGGGTLSTALSGGGTLTVSQWILDGVGQPAGTYTAGTYGTSSFAITGSGALTVVPEPSALVLLLTALLFWYRRRR